ncbi:type II toxin-antitoxin system prevent-host-death family antitoxin [Streptomyces clavuligerus]|uniref:Antitoxin n=1 Tax=Streptomyces clavuligerus TaxID=1901 RepID=B5GUF3_STRCL|nr:type II toxin-antitoxin system prevent-host-death family antitoxin [Streptomyces clavuligerus]EDY49949.1 hypothetical protein SSCG_03203 [Streptomyces clavuligerus]EFG03666.1 Hypothetical protein SCLAV_p0175 [Streptomyces clavuligerus]MBY6307779.1 type II toxin-antitoxin system prevent-host-death family antitoxin [Streptomyces clavuligerus]QCS10883.1 type II toxin-antitoxin system prevent-host-death family antitoxin [Streptomyces clavuligerus]QPJ98284.1 type II toxin-antitoxin system preven
MTESSFPIAEAGHRLGVLVREVGASGEPVALTEEGRTVAVLVSAADFLELQELRALAAYRERQALGEEGAGVPHSEAVQRVFGGDGT